MGISQEREPGKISLPLLDSRTGMPIMLDVETFRQPDGSNLVSTESLMSALGMSATADSDNVKFPCGLFVSKEQHLITIGGESIPEPLTKTEFSVFWGIASEWRRIHSRSEIMTRVWGGEYVGVQTVDVNILRIRRKLGADVAGRDKIVSPNHELIRTVSGSGYSIGKRAFSPDPLVFPEHLRKQAS